MKRLVFIISIFLVLVGNVGADQPNSSTVDQSALELAFWQTILDSDDPEMFQEYLVQFPEGLFAGLAKLIIKKLGGDTSTTATDTNTTSSSSTTSGDDKVWCATVKYYWPTTRAGCRSNDGKAFTSENLAEAETERLSAGSSNVSTAGTIWCATSKAVTNVSHPLCGLWDGKAFSSKRQAEAEHQRLKGGTSSPTSTDSGGDSVAYCYNSSRNLLYSNITSCGNQGQEISRKEFKEAIKLATNRMFLSNSHSISCLDEDGDLSRKPSSGCYDPDVEVSAEITCFYSLKNVDKMFVGSDTQYLRNAVLDCSNDNKIIGWKIGSRLPRTSTASSSGNHTYCRDSSVDRVYIPSDGICLSSDKKITVQEYVDRRPNASSSSTASSSSSNTTKKKGTGLLSGLKNLFSGSPFVTVQMSPSELRGISDKQLCNTYRMEGFYSGKTPAIINEVNRRGLDCYGAKGKCRAYGFKEGTSGFSGCVMQSEMKLVEEQREQNKATIDNAISNLNPPAPTPVEVCSWVTVYDVNGRQQRMKQCNSTYSCHQKGLQF